MSLDPSQQTKYDEWKEYYIYERRRYKTLMKEKEFILQLLEKKQNWQKYVSRLSDLDVETFDLGSEMGWIENQISLIQGEPAVSAGGESNLGSSHGVDGHDEPLLSRSDSSKPRTTRRGEAKGRRRGEGSLGQRGRVEKTKRN